jgi:hypothetical protein
LRVYKTSQVRRWRHSARWQNRIKHQLKIEPLCRFCKQQGIVEPATIVDHVVPHRGDQNLYWFGALASLCKPHHDRTKQRVELHGFSNEIGNDGWPLDPKHPANQAGG